MRSEISIIDFTHHQCAWEDHVSNGGTGLSKHGDPEIAASIALSVKEFGSSDFFMVGTELHTRRKGDCSDFWAFHRARTKEAS